MKKFYASLFTIVLLCSALVSAASTTYNSITDNNTVPGGPFTLDDSRFWQGGVPPPNPCNDCIIYINSDVSMVHSNAVGAPGNGSTAIDGTFLDNVTISNSTIFVKAGVAFTMNTYLQLKNTQVTIGSDPTSPAAIIVNNQVDMDLSSSIRLANDQTYINTNNDDGDQILGPRTFFGTPLQLAGIYIIRSIGSPSPANDIYDLSLNGTLNGNYSLSYTFGAYSINCDGSYPNSCANGIVYGPTINQYDAGNDFYGFQITAVLPVQLVLFTGTKQDDGTVKIDWATAQESNSAYYDVERSGSSTTSESGWVNIGRVAAKGNSSITTNYTLTDKTPLPGTGYYKLKMVDKDAKTTYSKIISVSDSKDDRALVIYSNPFSDQIRMKVSVGRAQNLKLTVTDMLGRSVITSTYPATVGDNFINLVPNAGGSGMYILHITGDTYDKTVKLEKQ